MYPKYVHSAQIDEGREHQFPPQSTQTLLEKQTVKLLAFQPIYFESEWAFDLEELA